MFFVHKLTVHFNELQHTLTKIQPTHTLRITYSNSSFFGKECRVYPNQWPTICHLNLKRLEVYRDRIDLCTIKQINDFPISEKVILARELVGCTNSDYLAYSHLFDPENPPTIVIHLENFLEIMADMQLQVPVEHKSADKTDYSNYVLD